MIIFFETRDSSGNILNTGDTIFTRLIDVFSAKMPSTGYKDYNLRPGEQLIVFIVNVVGVGYLLYENHADVWVEGSRVKWNLRTTSYDDGVYRIIVMGRIL